MIGSRLATVFGGTGFLGHAVVQALAMRGYRVCVPTRQLEKAKDLKLMGDVGQIVPVRASLRSDADIASWVEGADVVVNLVGIMAENRRETFQSVHVEEAARIARLARAGGVRNLAHVSALGADKASPSSYARTKALGEEAVRAFFPEAMIVRPSVMFGPRDSFLGRLERILRFSPVVPLIGRGQTRFQPVYVGDVAAALMVGLEGGAARGQTFALTGPKIYTFRQLVEGILQLRAWRRTMLPLSWGASRLLTLMPGLVTADQLKLLRKDNTLAACGGALPTLRDLGIRPMSLETYGDQRQRFDEDDRG